MAVLDQKPANPGHDGRDRRYAERIQSYNDRSSATYHRRRLHCSAIPNYWPGNLRRAVVSNHTNQVS